MFLVIQDHFGGRGEDERFVGLEEGTLVEVLRGIFTMEYCNDDEEDEAPEGEYRWQSIENVEDVEDEDVEEWCRLRWCNHECENFALDIYEIVDKELVRVFDLTQEY